MTLDRIYRMLLSSLAVALLALVPSACSHGGGDEPEPGITYHAGFYLTVGEVNGSAGQSSSRAPSDGTYDPGQGIENYIDLTKPGNIRVVLLDADTDILMGEITDFAITAVSPGVDGSSKRYHLLGNTTADISGGRFKVMVLANWPEYPSTLSLENVWKQEFAFAGAVPTKENPVPLFGIKLVNTGSIEPGVAANLGTLHLLRAVAKIEVILDDPTDSWHFSKLQLSSYHDRGTCAPVNVRSQDDYVKNNWANDYVSWTSVPDSATPQGPLDFVKADEGGKRWVLYVPEYRNSVIDAPQAHITLNFAESFRDDHEIVISDNSGNALDYHRNVWYKVTVKKLPETTELDWTVDVIPYAVIDLDPIFGIGPIGDDYNKQ